LHVKAVSPSIWSWRRESRDRLGAQGTPASGSDVGSCLAAPTGVVLVALVIGVALGGFLGVLIALPVTATLRTVVAYLYDRAAAAPSEPVGSDSN
jgi:hypothetical protein